MSVPHLSLQVVGGNLLREAVIWFFTSVLRGLQIHGQHEVCNSTLSQLAMLIYENLVRLKAAISAIYALFLDQLKKSLRLQLTIFSLAFILPIIILIVSIRCQ